MKKILYILITLVWPLLSFGNDEQGLIEKGNALYSKGQYKEALATYKQIAGSGYQSAALYYDLGNTYFRLDDIASSLLYFEKAHKLNPSDEDINVNIHFVNSKTVDKIDETPEFFISKWWHGFILSFSIESLAIMSIILFLLGSGALIFYFYSYAIRIKKIAFYGALVLFFFGIIHIIIAVGQVSYFNSHKQAIIFSAFVNVKGGPSDKASTLFVLHEGTKVDVVDIVNGWMRVKIANGNQGWVRLTDEKEI